MEGATKATNSGRKKLRILCIHGYRQNATMFREKSGSFRKLVKKYADFDFITAPHRVPPGNQGSAAWAEVKNDESEEQKIEEEVGERGWWFSREDDFFKSVDYSDITKGFDESLQLIVETLENCDTGYDGILGFSQGACLVSMLCLMQEKQKKDWFKFAILIAGFKSRSSPHNVHYSTIATIPTLHVYGETDQIISESMSEELLGYFKNPTILRHPGGHFIPGTSPQKQDYFSFMEAMCAHCGIDRS